MAKDISAKKVLTKKKLEEKKRTISSLKKKIKVAPEFVKRPFDVVKDQPIESAFSNMTDRLARIQKDVLMPAIALRSEGVQNTITVFGASRTKPPAVAQADLDSLLKRAKLKPSKQMEEKIIVAKRAVKMSKYYEQAEELCKRLQEWVNLKNFPKDEEYYIMTGGGPGIMEAANKGAFKAGGRTVGLTITIPGESPNPYLSPELSLNFHYFLMRKFWLLFFAKAIIVFPGGTGTFDEFFEVFTLMKTRKTSEYIPVVLFGSEFWKSVVNFDALVESDVITKADLNFFKMTDTIEEAYNYITSEIERLYLKKK